MTAYTKTNLITDVLATLGVIGAGDTPSAEDLTFLGRVYDVKFAELSDRELVYWPNTGLNVPEIPSQVYGVLSDVLVNHVSGVFGKMVRPPLDVRAAEDLILKGLRRHMAREPSGFPTRIDTF